MTTYYCKCGREVKKSTKAATTGNRDTEGCTGCPYLLPYGPYEWNKEQKRFTQTVAGHECRMTDHPVDYASHVSSCGGPNDKTVLHIESLDFDFLNRVCSWVKETFSEGELSGSFDRTKLRPADYMDGVRVTFCPSQNKKGAAAKQQLFRRFFHPDGTRLDMNPEEEKAKVMADIEAGKTAQRKEFKMNKAYEKNPHDKPQECTAEEIESIIRHIPTGYTNAEAFHKICREAKDQSEFNAAMLGLETCGLMFNRDNLYIDSENTLRCDHDSAGVHFYVGERVSYLPFPVVLDKLWEQAQKYKSFIGETVTDAKKKITNLKELGLSDNCIRYLHDMGFEETDVDILYGLLPEEEERLQRDFPDNWKRIQAFVKNKRLSADIDDVAQEGSSTGANPPSSTAATAAVDEPVESPEPAVLTPTTETAAVTSEQANDAVTTAPASEGIPAVFDYSGLDIPTVDTLHWAERRIKEARSKYVTDVAETVAIVHDELVRNSDEHNNQYSEDTFTVWCKYIGLSKSTAYQLLQVNKLLTSSTPEEAAQLEQASPSLLYAAAKPSAPAELVQAVKEGDITSHKQYQDALARIKQLEQNAVLDAKERDAAYAKADKYKAECARRAQDQQRLEGLVESANQKADLAAQKSAEAWDKVQSEQAARKKAESDCQEAQNQRDGARQALQAAKLRGDKLKEENEALKSRPIEAAVVDQSEVNRRAQEIVDRQTSEQAEESQRNAYDNVLLSLRSIENNWTLAINAFRSLPADMQRGLTDKLLKFSAKVKEDTQCL